MAQDIVMVVGLGNPGSDYENTRHNAGALFVEALAREAGQTLRPEKKYHGLYARIQWQGLDLHLLNPSTFMNRSGIAIKASEVRAAIEGGVHRIGMRHAPTPALSCSAAAIRLSTICRFVVSRAVDFSRAAASADAAFWTSLMVFCSCSMVVRR